MKDDIVTGIVCAVLILLSSGLGYRYGERAGVSKERTAWQIWCLDNNYAEFDARTGKLQLFDKKYINDRIKREFPDLFDQLFKDDSLLPPESNKPIDAI